MEQVTLNGRVVRPKGEEFKNTGIFILFSNHIKVKNIISASVRYFRLDIDITNQDFEYIKDAQFICPREHFVNNFEIMIEDGTNQNWEKMS